LILAAFLLVSCSGDSTGPEPEDNTGGATETITPDGGRIVATTASGATVTLDFPPDAVGSPIAITLQPADVSGDAFFSMLLEPAGMIFLEDVAVTVTVPDGVAFSDQQLFFGDPADPTLIPTMADVDARTLVTSVRSFGIPAGDIAVAAQSAKTAATPNNLGGMQQSCQQILAQAQASFDRLLDQEDYDAAINSALESAALLQKATCFNDSQQWLTNAAAIVCGRFEAAIDSANALPITGPDDFDEHVQPIIEWAAVAARISPDCPAQGTYVGAIEAEINDFLAWYTQQLQALTSPDLKTFSNLKQGLLRTVDLLTQALSMGLDEAANKIESQAFHPTLDQMRETAYGLGHNDRWHYALTKLTTWGFYAGRDIIGVADPRRCDTDYTPPRCYPAPPSRFGYLSGGSFTNEDIYDDIQFCATDIELTTLVASDSVYTSDSAGGDGAPGQRTNELLIDCPTRGTIVIGGEIAALTCFTTDEPADDELVVKLSGTDIRTIPRPAGGDEYLQGTPVEIDIIQAAEDAGITPKQGTSHDLTIVRHRPNCSDRLWGETEFTLLTTTLDWINPTAEVEVQMPQSIDPGQTVNVDVRVKVIDQLGNAGFFDAIDLVLQPTGGVLSQTNGQTDAQGYFHTQFTADASQVARAGKATTQPIEVTATATTFEGVTAQGSATANTVDVGYARVVSVEYYGRGRAGGFGVFDEKEDEQLSPGSWSFSADVQADSTHDGKTYNCSASVSASIELSESADTLKTIVGSIHALTDLTADGAFSAVEFPEGIAQAEMRVNLEVLDGPVGVVIDASTVATGRYIITLDVDGGGYGTLYHYDTPPATLHQLWGLGPGMRTLVFSVYDRVSCGICTQSASTDLDFNIEIGGPPLGGD
jgi:hypothetical protein